MTSCNMVSTPGAPPATPQLAAPSLIPAAVSNVSAPEIAQVKVPLGLEPGAIFQANVNGLTVQVTVPPGATAGQLVTFGVGP